MGKTSDDVAACENGLVPVDRPAAGELGDEREVPSSIARYIDAVGRQPRVQGRHRHNESGNEARRALGVRAVGVADGQQHRRAGQPCRNSGDREVEETSEHAGHTRRADRQGNCHRQAFEKGQRAEKSPG